MKHLHEIYSENLEPIMTDSDKASGAVWFVRVMVIVILVLYFWWN